MKTFFWVAILIAGNCCAQAPAKDAETLEALLIEVRQLRHSIEGMTTASQRVQIALYGLQLQDAAVARSAQRLDEARNRPPAIGVGPR